MRKRLRNNNKGASLIFVIVSIAFVSMLVVTVLYAALMNIQMKTIDKKSKDSFYSAEDIMNQIKVGLRSNMSVAMDSAYVAVMQQYGNYSETEREEKSKAEFKTKYLAALRSEVKDASDDTKFNLDLLKQYIDKDEVSSGRAVLSTVSGKTPTMDVYMSGVVLRNVNLEYTDKNGVLSIISTDIRMGVPELNFTFSSALPDLFSYSLIADTGIGGKSQGTLSINGNVYAGEEGITLGEGTNAVWSVASGGYTIVSKGTITTINKETSLVTASDTKLWANNIELKKSNINASGDTYVADDLTLSGDGSVATLSGKYIGFGNSDTAEGDVKAKDRSSSIVVNGKNSVLNLNTDTLVVAGHSYIGTSTIDSKTTGQTNGDVMMGESIAVKGDQIAYLVPAECIGVKDGKSLYGKNPLDYSEYQEIHASGSGISEVVPAVTVASLKEPLANYMDLPATVNDEYLAAIKKQIQTVFVPKGGSMAGGQVYYYLNLSDFNAEKYFKAFYDNNQELVETYLDFYSNGIVVKKDDPLVAGRFLTYNTNAEEDEDKSTLHDPTDEDVMNNLKVELSGYSNNYYALTRNLTNYYASLTSEQKARTVVQNLLVDWTALNKFFTERGINAGGQYTFVTTDGAGNEIKAVIVNGNYTYDSSADPESKVHMIIATGDITIAKDFAGTAIAGKGALKGENDPGASGGHIYVTNAASKVTVSADEVMTRLFKACTTTDPTATDATFLYSLFRNGSRYVTNRISTGSGGLETEAVVDLGDCLSYENWTKK